MAVNSLFEVKLTATFQGDVVQNVFHYLQRTEGTPSGNTAEVGQLMAAFKSDVLLKIVACQCGDVKYQTLRVQRIDIPKPIIQKDGLTNIGQQELDPLPAQDAVLFVKRCNVGGKENVGKNYIAGVPDEWAQGGLVTVTNATLVALAVQLKTDITNDGATFSPIVYHRGPKTGEFVTRVDIRSQVSRQNRRHLPVY